MPHGVELAVQSPWIFSTLFLKQKCIYLKTHEQYFFKTMIIKTLKNNSRA